MSGVLFLMISDSGNDSLHDLYLYRERVGSQNVFHAEDLTGKNRKTYNSAKTLLDDLPAPFRPHVAAYLDASEEDFTPTGVGQDWRVINIYALQPVKMARVQRLCSDLNPQDYAASLAAIPAAVLEKLDSEDIAELITSINVHRKVA